MKLMFFVPSDWPMAQIEATGACVQNVLDGTATAFDRAVVDKCVMYDADAVTLPLIQHLYVPVGMIQNVDMLVAEARR